MLKELNLRLPWETAARNCSLVFEVPSRRVFLAVDDGSKTDD